VDFLHTNPAKAYTEAAGVCAANSLDKRTSLRRLQAPYFGLLNWRELSMPRVPRTRQHGQVHEENAASAIEDESNERTLAIRRINQQRGLKMARKQTVSKPLVDVMHDYADALKAVQDASSILYQAAKSIVDLDKTMRPEVRKILADACKEYHRAMYGEN